jgi:hypothetical protein
MAVGVYLGFVVLEASQLVAMGEKRRTLHSSSKSPASRNRAILSGEKSRFQLSHL